MLGHARYSYPSVVLNSYESITIAIASILFQSMRLSCRTRHEALDDNNTPLSLYILYISFTTSFRSLFFLTLPSKWSCHNIRQGHKHDKMAYLWQGHLKDRMCGFVGGRFILHMLPVVTKMNIYCYSHSMCTYVGLHAYQTAGVCILFIVSYRYSF